jgi:hypothetical protein
VQPRCPPGRGSMHYQTVGYPKDANHLSMVMHQEPASKVSEGILEILQMLPSEQGQEY